MADMLGVMLRGLGVDPQAIMDQAAGLSVAFNKLASMQEEALAQLATVRAGQDAIMAAMGLYVAPPTGAVAALIADESRRHIDQFGGDVTDAAA